MCIQIFVHFKIDLYVFSLLVFKSLCILVLNPLSGILFSNIFSHYVDCHFTFLIVSMKHKKILILILSNLSTFSFVTCGFGLYLINHCLI